MLGTGTHEDITAQLQGATHLHFACHGRFDTHSPLDSALYFAGEETLTLRDLLANTLDVSAARLVVLSAYQTGLTDFHNVPDGAVGFPAGFIQASVPGIVSTLWPVNDLSTALLLTRFYRHCLKDKLEPAAALHKAQVWLRDSTAGELGLAGHYARLFQASGRRDPRLYHTMRYHKVHPRCRPFTHAYYWAPFVFSGV
ncbi:MAG: CHAT domain-containing protein [Candidatus Entotheonellia bacterium]